LEQIYPIFQINLNFATGKKNKQSIDENVPDSTKL